LDEFVEPFDEEGVVGDIGYWWHIESEPPMLRHTVTLYGSGYPIVETHDQYLYELHEIQTLLEEYGFQWELIDPRKYDDLYLNEKWMFKAKKERNV
jgi:hypothetical protein